MGVCCSSTAADRPVEVAKHERFQGTEASGDSLLALVYCKLPATWELNKLTLHRLSRDGQANAVVLRNERLPSDITMARLVAVDQRSVWVHESTGTAPATPSGTCE